MYNYLLLFYLNSWLSYLSIKSYVVNKSKICHVCLIHLPETSFIFSLPLLIPTIVNFSHLITRAIVHLLFTRLSHLSLTSLILSIIKVTPTFFRTSFLIFSLLICHTFISNMRYFHLLDMQVLDYKQTLSHHSTQ